MSITLRVGYKYMLENGGIYGCFLKNGEICVCASLDSPLGFFEYGVDGRWLLPSRIEGYDIIEEIGPFGAKKEAIALEEENRALRLECRILREQLTRERFANREMRRSRPD